VTFYFTKDCYGEKNSALSHYRKMGACPLARIFLEQKKVETACENWKDIYEKHSKQC